MLVVDDNPAVRGSIERFLRTVAGIECVGSALDGAQAIALAERHQPDVVVMTRGDSVDAAIQIRNRWPQIKVVVLADWVSARLRVDPDVLLGAIQTAAAY